jgi:hypothetical protein
MHGISPRGKGAEQCVFVLWGIPWEIVQTLEMCFDVRPDQGGNGYLEVGFLILEQKPEREVTKS